jgi:hypothetical protein
MSGGSLNYLYLKLQDGEQFFSYDATLAIEEALECFPPETRPEINAVLVQLKAERDAIWETMNDIGDRYEDFLKHLEWYLSSDWSLDGIEESIPKTRKPG